MREESNLTGTAPVRTGLIGLGEFGHTFWLQAHHMNDLHLVALCDQQGEASLKVLQGLGPVSEGIRLCESVREAQSAMRAGMVPLVQDGTLLAELDISVIVEASGSPAAGAAHGLAALAGGKHVVMVNKETACTVGHVLAAVAADKGLNFDMADGDQPRQILDFLDWSETLGLEVVCAGKAGEVDHPVDFSGDGIWNLSRDEDLVAETVLQRSRLIPQQQRAGVADLAELAIVINERGLGWDRPVLHAPVMHFQEMPAVLRPQSEGGILDKTPVLEVANLLSHPLVPSMAGGVFVVVQAPAGEDWSFLVGKRHLMSQDARHLFLYRPFHLLGIETGLSVLKVAQNVSRKRSSWKRPWVDVFCRAERDLPAGTGLKMDHGHRIADMAPELGSFSACAAEDCIPYYLAAGNSLARPVSQGSLLRCRDISAADNSIPWRLRMPGHVRPPSES